MASAWGTAWGDAWGDSWGVVDVVPDPSVGSGGGGGIGFTGWDGRAYPFPGDEKPAKPLGHQRAYFEHARPDVDEPDAEQAEDAQQVIAKAASQASDKLRQESAEAAQRAMALAAHKTGIELAALKEQALQLQAEKERQRIEEEDIAFIAAVMAIL